MHSGVRFSAHGILSRATAGALVFSILFTLPYSSRSHAQDLDPTVVDTCKEMVNVQGGTDKDIAGNLGSVVSKATSENGGVGSKRGAHSTILGFDTAGNSTGSWIPEEHDQWCANHGILTNEEVRPKYGPGVTEKPSADGYTRPDLGPKATQCAHADRMVEKGDDDCKALTKKLKRCQSHKGQLEKMCAAYVTAADGIAWQWVLALLDTAASLTCATACYTAMSGDFTSAASGWSKACTIAACAGGVAETVATVAMNTSSESSNPANRNNWDNAFGAMGALGGMGKCAAGISAWAGEDSTQLLNRGENEALKTHKQNVKDKEAAAAKGEDPK